LIRQAVILAGGKGTRLGELTNQTPKPALEVGGIPFVGHLIWNLSRHGIKHIILSTGYLADELEQAVNKCGVEAEIVFVREYEALGTGGGLRNALPYLDERFLVLNGDSLFDVNYLDLNLLLEAGIEAALALRLVSDADRYGSVILQEKSVVGFREKGHEGPGMINGGVYAMKRKALNRLPPSPSSLEHDLFPQLAEEGRLRGSCYDGYFIDIGLPESLSLAQKEIPSWRRKMAVFLDRDGVLNEDYGYVHTIDKFVWLPGAIKAIKHINDHGYLAILITNQSGIGRGYYPEETFWELTNWMQEQLNEQGAHLDGIYFCPHHPESAKGAFLKACDCRKPEPGMIKKAAIDWKIDLANSIVIGDKESDLEAGRRAGVGKICSANDLNLYDLVVSSLTAPMIAEN
jgi:D,D-heptose 1,7-bisphosphate phosphatase